MNILVVGDVHGCYFTLKHLVKTYWQPEFEFLVQVGDLINKGPHSGQCVKFMRKLKKQYPYRVFVLKGNHEDRYLKYHDQPGFSKSIDLTQADFIRNEMNLKKLNTWLKELPYLWENPYMLITHAGISKSVRNPYNYTNPRGVLHNRSELRNVGKLQVYGHMIQADGKMLFSASANAWCIDTGAWIGQKLSALRISEKGALLEKIQVQTMPEDMVRPLRI
jgi:serine/threonine protein phosphatase 1